MLIAMGAIMLTAVGVDRGMQYFEDQRLEAERLERYEQAYADVANIEMTISQLARDQKAIEAYLEEHREFFDEAEGFAEESADFLLEDSEGDASDGMKGGLGDDMNVSGNGTDCVSSDELGGVSGNGTGSVSENSIGGVSDNAIGTISANDIGDISGNKLREISGNGIFQVSGNEMWSVTGDYIWDADENVWRNVSGNIIDPFALSTDMAESDASDVKEQDKEEKELTLLERRKIRGSYMETRMQNKSDQELIAQRPVDFSEVSIACLGDSITAAANLEDEENYLSYAYPAVLGELLGADEVYNLGIGGSSIGRYWADAFVERYTEIPEDTDIIIVMGGTNDGFCLSEEEFGTLSEREPWTFCGDLDELMRGLRENYPDAEIYFATPLPNILQDYLMRERDYLLPQRYLVNVILTLSAEYDFHVIDLYNSNLLDSHDADIVADYMPDGVHANKAGYRILAEHIAAEVVRTYEEEE